MKQRLGPQDLALATPEQLAWLREWWKPEAADVAYNPDLTIPPYRFVVLGMDAEDKSQILDIETCDYYDKDDYLPLLSIGQMVELLGDKFIDLVRHDECDMRARKRFAAEWWIRGSKFGRADSDEIADALWQACLEVIPKGHCDTCEGWTEQGEPIYGKCVHLNSLVVRRDHECPKYRAKTVIPNAK